MNDSLNLMRARLKIRGGEAQQDRMIKDKRKALDKVVLYSYQGATVQKLGSSEQVKALINPNKVKQDYDDKTISIGYEYDYKPGTIFDWVNTGTKWLVYLQDLTELAYFKGDIRKCNFEIKWKDKDNKLCSTYVALTGPKETGLDSSIKEGISIDFPNHSLYFMVPSNAETLEYFVRYREFYLNGQCWRIEATDSISAPGIIEVNAVEYYSNKDEDNIAEGIVDDLIEIPEIPSSDINGDAFIKPKKTYTYEYLGPETGDWYWDNKLPLSAKVEGNKITLKWTTTYNGQFDLYFGEYPDNCATKTIVVESLF